MIGRAAVLVGIALLLAAAANALPGGLSWTEPLGRGLRVRAAEAGLVPVDLDAVRRLVGRPGLLLLDSRRPEDFRIGRLPGARSFPWTEAEAGRAAPPPAAGPVLVYCSNEFCDSSLELGRWLRSKGVRDVAIFVEGYEAWWNAKGAVDED